MCSQLAVKSDPSPELESSLQDLERKWRTITSSSDDPRSTMNVIEYGLGKQRRAEVYVNRVLRYLLDPEESHGMDDDFLEAFLQGLPESAKFDEDVFDLSDVRVREQVAIDDESDEDSSIGYADLVLDIPNEWFVLAELKFSAEETGTKFYSRATHIGNEPVGDYESGQYYLYLHQHNRPQASSCDFVNMSWRSFVGDVLDDFIAASSLKYPQRTTTQLHDLKSDLQSITNMNDQSSTDEEKIALYLEHFDAIEDVRDAFDESWDSYSHQWGSRLADSLSTGQFDIHRRDGEGYPEVVVPRSGEAEERWILRENGGDWQHIFKYGWYQHEESGEVLTDRASGSNDLRIGFYHRMQKNQDTAIRDHELKLNFRNMGSNPTEFINIYVENFEEREGQIEEMLTDTNAILTGNKRTLIEGEYEIPVDSHEDYFSAYTRALDEAFVDLVIEEPELIGVLEEIFNQSVDDYHNI